MKSLRRLGNTEFSEHFHGQQGFKISHGTKPEAMFCALGKGFSYRLGVFDWRWIMIMVKHEKQLEPSNFSASLSCRHIDKDLSQERRNYFTSRYCNKTSTAIRQGRAQ